MISIGNTGQLAVDVLLASLPGLQRVGFLDCPHVLPIAGAGATVSTSNERKGRKGQVQPQNLIHVAVEGKFCMPACLCIIKL